MEITPKKAALNELLTGGFVIGLLYSVQIFVTYLLNGNQSLNWLFVIYGLGVIAYCQIYFGRRMGAIKDVQGAGYSYVSALGFSVKMMLLSGFVVGFAGWLLQNVIDPAYGELLLRETIRQASTAMPSATEEQLDMVRKMSHAMMSVWGMIGVSIFSMLINGALVALLTSAFVKRPVNIMQNND
ncbi:MAG: DUF4199 domain-containing protein [Mucinivorans sp.]